MSHFIKQNDIIKVISSDGIDISTRLPVSNYMVQFDSQTKEFYLESIAPFEVPTKLYGSVAKNTIRILSTFHDRSMSTGVLLTGEKGSGKTMLAKNISVQLLEQGISTIVINECMHGDVFNRFIQSIDHPCVIMFDEFEKVYNSDKQEHLLTLLDGVFPTKKLFLFTTNETRRINDHLCNRPGRVFYTIKHHGLEDNFIREYCQDVLINQSYIDEICKLAMLFSAFNFDILKALIEEMNRYDESPTDGLHILNAIPEDRDSNFFDTELYLNSGIVDKSDIEDQGRWEGNPMRPQGFEIEYRNPEYDDDADDSKYWLKANVSYIDLVKADSVLGTFEFKNRLGQKVILTKRKAQYYNYKAF